ncbi:hypothetical protein LepocDRAFT_00003350 [Leptothrix ochracea L12]|uniref:Uncharacterized protein n=1 Tax=Leptothrix ochracea L12 TaxID=735332 RepID=I4Z5W1_9BURK|nr:hypothetical protein LepocDRAFT_00003350 [Leptothrix ochracea L12]
MKVDGKAGKHQIDMGLNESIRIKRQLMLGTAASQRMFMDAKHRQRQRDRAHRHADIHRAELTLVDASLQQVSDDFSPGPTTSC